MMVLGLTLHSYLLLCVIAAIAGLVRGFTGFALSAVAMALAVSILPPVELIPVLWWIELGASLMLMSGNVKDADWKMTAILVSGSAIGLFLGLSLTTSIDPKTSRIVALVILIIVTALQLIKIRLSMLTTTPGQLLTGVVAGMVTGLAGIGGMVIALFILSQNAKPSVMRSSMIAFLLLTSVFSFAQHMLFGIMDKAAVLRGLALLPPCLIGVWLGAKLFMPKHEHLYRPVCLSLLIGVGLLSLFRAVA